MAALSFSMSSEHRAVTVIRTFDSLQSVPFKTTITKVLISEVYLYVLTSENLCGQHALLIIIIIIHHRSTDLCKPDVPKKRLSVHLIMVFQFELCNCLNGEVMIAEFPLLLSGA